jgi:uncharacterized protein YjbI with pentapeptide repeats
MQILKPSTLEVLREWPAELSGASLVGAKADKADFSGAVLHGTVFDHADLSHTAFGGADIQGCSWTAAEGLTDMTVSAAE